MTNTAVFNDVEISNDYFPISFPSDFPSLEDSVMVSLKNGWRDYCFSNKQLREILKQCSEANISMVYRKQLDEDFVLEYIELIPCRFYFANIDDNNEVENIQTDMENLPVALIFCPFNNRSDYLMDANFKKKIKDSRKLAYFDDEGYPVYLDDLKQMREEKERKNNGV